MIRQDQSGFALPAALLMMVVIAAVTAALTGMAQENFKQTKVTESGVVTNFVSEGALNRMFSDMALYSALWDQQANLATKPSGYVEYNPASHSTTNGIPPCTTSVSCHRHMYPVGGGLVKIFGPLTSDGANVDGGYPITQQLDPDSVPDPDLTLGALDGWTQVERLDEEPPSVDSVGGNLSSSLAEGGNAKKVRFRVTGQSIKSLNQEIGGTTLVAVVLLPVS